MGQAGVAAAAIRSVDFAVSRKIVQRASSPAEIVRAVLSQPDERLDYAEAKLAFDAIVDPAQEGEAITAELERMANTARLLAGPGASGDARLAALRTLIYAAGPWNDHRPFDYDHSNQRGADVRVKLISNYLATRRGDCVSMPVLFLILADKLGLDMALSTVPLHYFLRYRDDCGRLVNLETTSGALPARDAWIRQTRPMSDRAVANGLYMRALTRRECVAAMAHAVIQHLNDERQYDETITVADVILEHYPRDAHALANKGNAYSKILRNEFLDRYGTSFLIPQVQRPRYAMLLAQNHAAFAAASTLGWEHCV